MSLPKFLQSALSPLLKKTQKRVSYDDTWEKEETIVKNDQFGEGCTHAWQWYFDGTSNIHVKSVKEICLWLSSCKYVDDKKGYQEKHYHWPVEVSRTSGWRPSDLTG